CDPSPPVVASRPSVTPPPAPVTTSAPVVASASARAPVAPPPPPSASPPEPPPVVVKVEFEDPYKMDERVEPTTHETWWAQFREHRMWNKGDLGELVGELPEVEGHPDPRVIVNVDKVAGPHDEAAVQ